MKEVIVVEGRDDTRRLKEVFGHIDTIETNGSAISDETIALIRKAHLKRGVIVFTDPDFPGQKIRQTIMDAIPNVKHAFITRQQGQSKKQNSLGVEHASDDVIREALKAAQQTVDDWEKSSVTKSLLLQLGLIGQSGSSYLRSKVCEMLQIGHTNGKQLLKRLQLFGISEQDLIASVNQVKEEQNGTV